MQEVAKLIEKAPAGGIFHDAVVKTWTTGKIEITLRGGVVFNLLVREGF